MPITNRLDEAKMVLTEIDTCVWCSYSFVNGALDILQGREPINFSELAKIIKNLETVRSELERAGNLYVMFADNCSGLDVEPPCPFPVDHPWLDDEYEEQDDDRDDLSVEFPPANPFPEGHPWDDQRDEDRTGISRADHPYWADNPSDETPMPF